MARRGKTPVRGIRIGTDLWQAAQRTADSRCEDLPEVIRDFLARYARDELRAARTARPTAIHHINGNSRDNRPENLEVVDIAAHARTATPTDTEETQP